MANLAPRTVLAPSLPKCLRRISIYAPARVLFCLPLGRVVYLALLGRGSEQHWQTVEPGLGWESRRGKSRADSSDSGWKAHVRRPRGALDKTLTVCHSLKKKEFCLVLGIGLRPPVNPGISARCSSSTCSETSSISTSGLSWTRTSRSTLLEPWHTSKFRLHPYQGLSLNRKRLKRRSPDLFTFIEEPPRCFPWWLHPFTFPPAAHKGSGVHIRGNTCCFLFGFLFSSFLYLFIYCI